MLVGPNVVTENTNLSPETPLESTLIDVLSGDEDLSESRKESHRVPKVRPAKEKKRLNPRVSEFVPRTKATELSQPVEQYVNLHDRVVESGLPNCLGLRVPLPTKFNIPWLRAELLDYDDRVVADMLQFGWPIGFEGETGKNSNPKNHRGALEFPGKVSQYLHKEIDKDAVLGPFKENPFQCRHMLSPLNSVPKRDNERRVILDLSFPAGSSVNDGNGRDV